MCTAISDSSLHHLFGRTLDLEYTLEERVVITPRRFAFDFLYENQMRKHHAIIGAAHISNNVPLYYDAMNEKGLCAAALRFPELAVYREKNATKHNLASFELIPWLLCNFESAKEARRALEKVNVTSDSFSSALTATPLHWLIGDKQQSFVIEPVAEGLKIYDNSRGVLTNAPDFPTQQSLLEKHNDLTPGDLSSTSRFIRAANAQKNTLSEVGNAAITRFFHVLGTVNQPNGLFRADERTLRTVYTSCMDTEDLCYYFTTYDCRRIRAVRLTETLCERESITSFSIDGDEDIKTLS